VGGRIGQRLQEEDQLLQREGPGQGVGQRFHDPVPVAGRHADHQIGLGHHPSGQAPGGVVRDVDPMFGGRPDGLGLGGVPIAGHQAGRGDRGSLRPQPALERGAQEALGDRRAADVPGTDDEDVGHGTGRV
jgi:hypothetical protein